MPTAKADDVRGVLAAYVSPMTAASMVRAAADRSGLGASRFERIGADAATLAQLRVGVTVFVPEHRRAECLAKLAALGNPSGDGASTAKVEETIVVEVKDENGIVDARTRAKSLAGELGFEPTEQYKIATAVSELSRNAFRYAGGGRVTIASIASPRPGISVIVRDEGAGIPNLAVILGGTYRSRTGLGKGLLGCKKIMDDFDVVTAPGRGTTVTVRKFL